MLRQHLVRAPLRSIHITAGLVMAAGLAADNYLPLYVRVSRGGSEEFAAFSVFYLTVGWTSAAVVTSRLLDRRRERDLIAVGSAVLIPALGVSAIGIATEAHLALIFAGYFAVGVAIGLVVTAGITMLQAASEASEIGRVNAAHQFIRTLGITYGIAIGRRRVVVRR